MSKIEFCKYVQHNNNAPVISGCVNIFNRQLNLLNANRKKFHRFQPINGKPNLFICHG